MTVRRIVIVGAGGFAREVAWLIKEINAAQPTYEFVGYVVTDLTKTTERDSKERLLGDTTWLRANPGEVDCLTLGIGSPAARLAVGADVARQYPHLEWPVLIHPSVRMDWSSSTIEPGVILCAGVYGTVNLRIRRFAMVNLSCTLGHEAEVGEGSVLNPTVNISGGVTIGRGVLVGTGAQILQYVSVGEEAVVGAGAVVLKDVMPKSTVVGMPAKPRS